VGATALIRPFLDYTRWRTGTCGGALAPCEICPWF